MGRESIERRAGEHRSAVRKGANAIGRGANIGKFGGVTIHASAARFEKSWEIVSTSREPVYYNNVHIA